tara:strand:- start:1349 stop:2071 length:723 start_codon:yes stop_codon:yes gene_type:complete
MLFIISIEEKDPKDSKTEYCRLEIGLNTVGRSKSNDVYIDHPMLSRHHADIDLFDDDVLQNNCERPQCVGVITDATSQNGTYVNGYVIEPNRKVNLYEDDRIDFGAKLGHAITGQLVSEDKTLGGPENSELEWYGNSWCVRGRSIKLSGAENRLLTSLYQRKGEFVDYQRLQSETKKNTQGEINDADQYCQNIILSLRKGISERYVGFLIKNEIHSVDGINVGGYVLKAPDISLNNKLSG